MVTTVSVTEFGIVSIKWMGIEYNDRTCQIAGNGGGGGDLYAMHIKLSESKNKLPTTNRCINVTHILAVLAASELICGA